MRKIVCKRLYKMAFDTLLTYHTKQIKTENGQVVNVGHKGLYRKLKKAYMKGEL